MKKGAICVQKSSQNLQLTFFYYYFSKTKAVNVGGGVEPSFVGNESDSHKKMCFSEPRGLFYVLWHEDTKGEPSSGSLVGLHTPLGLEVSVTSLPEADESRVARVTASPLCSPKLTS